jgi:hypothetical protein
MCKYRQTQAVTHNIVRMHACYAHIHEIEPLISETQARRNTVWWDGLWNHRQPTMTDEDVQVCMQLRP